MLDSMIDPDEWDEEDYEEDVDSLIDDLLCQEEAKEYLSLEEFRRVV